jgi:hypothetical protein
MRSAARRVRAWSGLRGHALSLLVLGAAALACSATKDSGSGAGLVDRLSGNQCDKQMTAFDARVAEMEELLMSGAAATEVLEDVERLRQDILGVQVKCAGSKTATKKLRALDRDLEALERRLAIESYR